MEPLLEIIVKNNIRVDDDDISSMTINKETEIERLTKIWRERPKEIFHMIDNLPYQCEDICFAYTLCALHQEGRLAKNARALFEVIPAHYLLSKDITDHVTEVCDAETLARITRTLNRACTFEEKMDVVSGLGLNGLGYSEDPARHACKMVVKMGWPALADAEPVAFAGRVLLSCIDRAAFLFSRKTERLSEGYDTCDDPRVFSKRDEEMILEVGKMLPQFVLGALCIMPFKYERQMNRILQSSDFESLAVCAQRAVKYLNDHPHKRRGCLPHMARICYLFGGRLDVFDIAYNVVHPMMFKHDYDILRKWYSRQMHADEDKEPTVFWQYCFLLSRAKHKFMDDPFDDTIAGLLKKIAASGHPNIKRNMDARLMPIIRPFVTLKQLNLVTWTVSPTPTQLEHCRPSLEEDRILKKRAVE